MSVLGTLGVMAGSAILGDIFGGSSSSSSGSGYQKTQVTPAERTSEGKVIWADFMKQLYGSGWEPKPIAAPPTPISMLSQNPLTTHYSTDSSHLGHNSTSSMASSRPSPWGGSQSDSNRSHAHFHHF